MNTAAEVKYLPAMPGFRHTAVVKYGTHDPILARAIIVRADTAWGLRRRVRRLTEGK